MKHRNGKPAHLQFDNQQQLEGGDEQIDGGSEFTDKMKEAWENAKTSINNNENVQNIKKTVKKGMNDITDQMGKLIENGVSTAVSAGTELIGKTTDKAGQILEGAIDKTKEKTGKLIDNLPTPGSKTSYTEQPSNNSLAIAARNALENDIPSDEDDINAMNDEDDDNINNFISRYVN